MGNFEPERNNSDELDHADLGTIHQRSKTSGRMGWRGGVGQSGRPQTGGSAINRTSIKSIFLAQKNIFLARIAKKIPYWSLTPPPSPVDRNIFWSGSQYILRFGRI